MFKFPLQLTSHEQPGSGGIHSAAVERTTLDLSAVVRHDIVDGQLTQHAQLRSIVAITLHQQSSLNVLQLDAMFVAVEQLTTVLQPTVSKAK